MNTRNLYPLTGTHHPKPDWIITTSLRPDLNFSTEGQNNFLSASPFSLLKAEQIPLKWLKVNPGFPILLIESSDLERDWVFHPYDETKNHFQLRQGPALRKTKTLVVLEENALPSDIALFQKKLAGDVRFIFRDRENFDLMKEAPIFNSYFFCFQSFWAPDLIVFQEPRYSKCLRPHILHAIHMGGMIETDYWAKKPTQRKELWYGVWEFFHV